MSGVLVSPSAKPRDPDSPSPRVPEVEALMYILISEATHDFYRTLRRLVWSSVFCVYDKGSDGTLGPRGPDRCTLVDETGRCTVGREEYPSKTSDKAPDV